jgi:hypothetical protein
MLILASVVTFSSQSVLAAVVDSGPVNIPIPATIDGIYFNIATGANGITPGAVPGWDIDPFQQTGPVLAFFWTATSGGVGAANVYTVLAPGATIDGTSTFVQSAQAAASVNFKATLPNAFLGVHFTNEGTGAINFGWIELSTTGPTGFPATIIRYAFENTGAAITIPPITPVRLQSFDVD